MGRACRLHGHGFNSNRPNSFFALFPLDGEANSEAFRIRGDRSVVCPRNSALDIELFKEDRDVPPCNVRHHDVVCDGDRFCWISFQCFLFPKKGGSPFCFCLPRPRRRIGSSHFLLERSSLNGRIMKRGIGNVCVCVCVSGNKLRIARFSCSSACLEGLESDSLNWRRICWPRKKDNIGNEQVNSFPYKFLRNRPMITRFHSVKPSKINGNLRKALPKRMETK